MQSLNLYRLGNCHGKSVVLTLVILSAMAAEDIIHKLVVIVLLSVVVSLLLRLQASFEGSCSGCSHGSRLLESVCILFRLPSVLTKRCGSEQK